ncbi:MULTISPECIES: hypothetical protein [unclassified Paraburkholderia]|uniref:hypothetical protein n=1 Tax=unclassified Paraburkholderia TaxID=2615204 RepID=UPI002AB022EC|nr:MULTISPECIES: hypothetical protein [unclassified Paraburkholderia]
MVLLAQNLFVGNAKDRKQPVEHFATTFGKHRRMRINAARHGRHNDSRAIDTTEVREICHHRARGRRQISAVIKKALGVSLAAAKPRKDAVC